MSQQKMAFRKADKKKSKLRLALIGPSGAGKTYSALRIATELSKRMFPGKTGNIGVIDSERGSAEKYADLFDFQTLPLESFSPLTYVEAIELAETEGFDFLVIDSLSHAWTGKDGALEQVDKVQKRSEARAQGGNSFTAWREVTPMHNQLVDSIVRSRCHVIASMRVKTEYVLEDKNGKKVPRKVGLAPVQRDGLEYEFDVVADMNIENELIIGKTRCPALSEGVFKKPGPEVAKILFEWVNSGADVKEEPKAVDVVKALMEDAEVKELFDKLEAPEAKRKVTVEKYEGDRDKLINALKSRLEEKHTEKQHSTKTETPPTTPPPASA